jgi:hypothetical protein
MFQSGVPLLVARQQHCAPVVANDISVHYLLRV